MLRRKTDPALRDKLTYLNTSIEGLPLPGSEEEQFDVLSLFEVIEHIERPADRVIQFRNYRAGRSADSKARSESRSCPLGRSTSTRTLGTSLRTR